MDFIHLFLAIFLAFHFAAGLLAFGLISSELNILRPGKAFFMIFGSMLGGWVLLGIALAIYYDKIEKLFVVEEEETPTPVPQVESEQ